jgi:hypothetical protein
VAPIVMTPEVDGPNRRYRATGAFNLAHFLAPPSNGSGKSSCAGPQLDFPVQQVQGFADAWVPFDESIAIGWD